MLTPNAGMTMFARSVVLDVSSKFVSVSDREHRSPRRASGDPAYFPSSLCTGPVWRSRASGATASGARTC